MYLIGEIQKTFPQMRSFFTQEQWDAFLACSFETLYAYHFSLGMRIRNELLNEGSELEKAFAKSGIVQKDDMSTLMIQLLYIAHKE